MLYSLRRVLAAEMKHVYLGPDRIGEVNRFNKDMMEDPCQETE